MARHGAAGLTGQNLASPALAVSAGDSFELSVWQSAGASLNVLVRHGGRRIGDHPEQLRLRAHQ
jgi:hypothetical protein